MRAAHRPVQSSCGVSSGAPRAARSYFHGKITPDVAERRLAEALAATGAGPAFLVFELEVPVGRFSHVMRYRRSTGHRGKRWLLRTPWGQTPGEGMVVLVGDREEVFRSMEHFLMMNRTRLRLPVPLARFTAAAAAAAAGPGPRAGTGDAVPAPGASATGPQSGAAAAAAAATASRGSTARARDQQ